MSASVTVITGPAASGKTERLLARYREVLRAGNVGGGLWIAPTHRSAQSIRERLLSAGFRACFRPGVMTFAQFAEAVLAASNLIVHPITDLAKRQIVRRLLREEAKRGRLAHFKAIAGTAGLVDLVTEFIGELKRHEIWPEDFERACRQRTWQAKDRDLVALYAAYQRHLNDRQLYDAEGRFWSAREVLRDGQTRPFENLQCVVVDGFTDFTRTQREILEILAARVAELLVSLPLEEGDDRRELFGKPRRTLARLRDVHPALTVETLPRRAPPPWAAQAHVEVELFKNPRLVRPATDARGIEIMEAARTIDELRLVGRRIKQLLTGGDPENGRPVRPADVAVVLRSPAPLGHLVREVFDELGLPLALESGRPLAAAPATSALVALLRLDIDDWPFRALLAALNSNYFQPDWPEWRGGRAAAAAGRAIRELQLARGRVDLLAALRRAGEANDDATGEDDADAAFRARRREDALRALAIGERLAAAYDRFPARATAGDWAHALAALATETGLSRTLRANPDSQSAELDQQAWDLLIASLTATERFTAPHGGTPEQFDAAELLDLVSDIVDFEKLPAGDDEVGRVRVLAATSVRALEIPYLFFAGLSETAFPPPDRADRLYSEREYERLAAAGLPLVLRAERGQEEMLLFYEVITRATRRLCLSYPGLDDKGEPLLPSPYLLELEHLFGANCVKRYRIEDLSPLPHDRQAYSPAEQRILAVAEALSNDSGAGMRGSSLDAAGSAGAGERAGPMLAKSAVGKAGSRARPSGRRANAGPMLFSTLAEPAAHGELAPRDPTALLAGLASSLHTAPVLENILAGMRTIDSRAQRDAFGPFEGMLDSRAAADWLAGEFGSDKRFSASRLEQYGSCPFKFFLQNVLRLKPVAELALETDLMARGSRLHEVLARLHQELNRACGGPTSPTAPEAAAAFREAAARLAGAPWSGAGDGVQPLEAALAEIDRRLIAAWLDDYVGQYDAYEAVSSDMEKPPVPAHFEVSFGHERRTEDLLSTVEPLALETEGEQILIQGRIDRIDLGQVAGVPVFNVLDYKSGRVTPKKAILAGDAMQAPLYVLAAERLLAGENRVGWRAGYWFVAKGGWRKDQSLEVSEQSGRQVCPTDEWQELRQATIDRVVALVQCIRQGQFPVVSREERCTSYCEFRTVCRVNQARSLEKTWEPLPR
ncbi:MAG: PD-(D/E)XK nuclease family protein [Planctomycetia bacterium]|nr:PD-(D/E)XK nuclease family protein [Planctomycetia bacterium]